MVQTTSNGCACKTVLNMTLVVNLRNNDSGKVSGLLKNNPHSARILSRLIGRTSVIACDISGLVLETRSEIYEECWNVHGKNTLSDSSRGETPYNGDYRCRNRGASQERY